MPRFLRECHPVRAAASVERPRLGCRMAAISQQCTERRPTVVRSGQPAPGPERFRGRNPLSAGRRVEGNPDPIERGLRGRPLSPEQRPGRDWRCERTLADHRCPDSRLLVVIGGINADPKQRGISWFVWEGQHLKRIRFVAKPYGKS